MLAARLFIFICLALGLRVRKTCKKKFLFQIILKKYLSSPYTDWEGVKRLN